MTPAQKLELEYHAALLECERRLREGAADSEVYDLVLQLTGSEEKASEVYAARLLARLRRGETPEV